MATIAMWRAENGKKPMPHMRKCSSWAAAGIPVTGRFFTEKGIAYWTADIDPSTAVWGEPGRHVVADVQQIDSAFPVGYFDALLLNGVFGFGLDDRGSMNRALTAAHRILKPGGILMIGWNSGLVPDPLELESIKRHFEPTAPARLPQRKIFPGTTHVYDFFKAV